MRTRDHKTAEIGAWLSISHHSPKKGTASSSRGKCGSAASNSSKEKAGDGGLHGANLWKDFALARFGMTLQVGVVQKR